MSIFNVITLFGGLAMFLYGMRLMGDSLKESSSGAMKKAMESVTNSPIKAFLLGLVVTAVIQSSTATIVITSGLVGAGIITLRQSLGIIIGANVGTTVTGQIIRLLDLNTSSTQWLQIFKPSTLAPVALIIGIILIMFIKSSSSESVGGILIGFGILFSGLLNMTGAVDSLSETGVFESAFASLGNNPVLGYITGATIAFILQSSSATIGILQAFASSGQLTFKAVYAVIVGIYLGDCVTTAIVCSIGAKSDAKRVGIVNILFNLSETVLVLAVVSIARSLGAFGSFWNEPITSGGIANTNTIFNLSCAITLLPMVNVYEKLSKKIVKDDEAPSSKYADKLESLSPTFFSTPAIALGSCYDVLMTMLKLSKKNISKAVNLLYDYHEDIFKDISGREDDIDTLADAVSRYLSQLAPHVSDDTHSRILDQYYKDVTEFERLGDHAMNIAERAQTVHKADMSFSNMAKEELRVLTDLIDRILENATEAFEKRDIDAARAIEPMEEVVDDMVNALNDNHLVRLRAGECNVITGTEFLNVMSDIERISDICSNIGVATVARVEPEMGALSHEYVTSLHRTDYFSENYKQLHDYYFAKLSEAESNSVSATEAIPAAT